MGRSSIMLATITMKKRVGKYDIVSHSIMDFNDATRFFNHEDFVSSHRHHDGLTKNLNKKYNGWKPR
jgi:hypothetical protein